MLGQTMPGRVISGHIISYHIISYHIISYHIISYHVGPCQIMSGHVMPYNRVSTPAGKAGSARTAGKGGFFRIWLKKLENHRFFSCFGWKSGNFIFE